MAISDEMKQELQSLIENAEIVKAMFKEQDSVDYEIGDYDEPITQMLSHMNEIMETIDEKYWIKTIDEKSNNGNN